LKPYFFNSDQTCLLVLPESLRAAANEEPDDFDLGASHEGSGHVMLSLGNNDPDEWQKAEEKERRDEEEAGNNKKKKEFLSFCTLTFGVYSSKTT
jgi:hypothetical protein